MTDQRSGRFDIGSAREIIQALGGRWHGSYGTARCAANGDSDVIPY